MHVRISEVAARVRGFFQCLGHSLAEKRWSTMLGRILLLGAGLVVLALVGHATTARSATNATSPTTTPSPPLDALADASAPLTAPAVASVAPSPSPAPPDARCAQASSHARATPDDPVFLNTATLDDLHRLPGVGEKRAVAILELRAKLGRFRQVEDLLRVKGIGRASLRKLRPLVRIDPPPVTGGAAAASTGEPSANAPVAPPARTP